MKKVLTIALAIIMCFSICIIPSFAVTPSTLESVEVEIPVFNSYDDFKEFLDEKYSRATPYSTDLIANFSGAIYRTNGADDETCTVFVNWSGNVLIPSIRYKQIKIYRSNLLFSETYGTIGNGSTYQYRSISRPAMTGVVTIGNVEIPTDVETVRIKATDFQAYYLDPAMWVAAVSWSGQIDVKD